MSARRLETEILEKVPFGAKDATTITISETK